MITSGDEAELKVKIPSSEDGEDPPPPALDQDRQLYDKLLRAEFRGPRYDVFTQELWTYGIRTDGGRGKLPIGGHLRPH